MRNGGPQIGACLTLSDIPNMQCIVLPKAFCPQASESVRYFLPFGPAQKQQKITQHIRHSTIKEQVMLIICNKVLPGILQ